MNLNKAVICGNLTRSPDLRRGALNGTPIANFDVATNRAWNDGDGIKHEEVEYHHIVVFGRQAEPVAEHLRKGQLVLVEGRLRTRSWEKAGEKHYKTEIVAERVQFGPKRQVDTMEASYGADAGEGDQGEVAALEISEDDIPF